MRVVMLIHSFYPHIGGAERQLLAQIPLLIKGGIQPIVITRAESNTLTQEVVNGALVYRVDTNGSKMMRALRYIRIATKLIHQINPEIIHSYDLISTSTTAVIAKILFGIPVVTKILSSGAGGDITRIKRKFFGKIRLGFYKKQIDRFFCVSKQIETELLAERFNPECILKIPNGIDSEKYHPINLSEKKNLKQSFLIDSSFIGLYMGRFAAEKNIHSLINAWQKLIIEQPDALLLLVGDGELKNELMNLPHQNVQFIPKQDDVLPYLQISDCFILPSEREGLSNALLEAMSCEVVPVVSEVVGNVELVEDHKTGLLFPVGNIDALNEALVELNRNQALQKKLQRNARDFIIENFELNSVVSSVIKGYKEVIYG